MGACTERLESVQGKGERGVLWSPLLLIDIPGQESPSLREVIVPISANQAIGNQESAIRSFMYPFVTKNHGAWKCLAILCVPPRNAQRTEPTRTYRSPSANQAVGNQKSAIPSFMYPFAANFGRERYSTRRKPDSPRSEPYQQ
jgi:hypothetical protein